MILKTVCGLEFLVDEDDFDKLKNRKWYKFKCRKTFYIHTLDGRKKIWIHRIIMNVIDNNLIIDHKNRNTLDNRKENLRICSPLENSHNRIIPKTNTTGYKGVYFRKDNNKFRSVIVVNKKRINLGQFDTAIEAAIAYNNAAMIYYGDYAYLNEIKEDIYEV